MQVRATAFLFIIFMSVFNFYMFLCTSAFLWHLRPNVQFVNEKISNKRKKDDKKERDGEIKRLLVGPKHPLSVWRGRHFDTAKRGTLASNQSIHGYRVRILIIASVYNSSCASRCSVLIIRYYLMRDIIWGHTLSSWPHWMFSCLWALSLPRTQTAMLPHYCLPYTLQLWYMEGLRGM